MCRICAVSAVRHHYKTLGTAGFLTHTMPHLYQFNVTMSCSGCSNAVLKALGRLEGVTDTNVSLDAQQVDVTTVDSLDYDTVYNAISKTGKKIVSGKTIN